MPKPLGLCSAGENPTQTQPGTLQGGNVGPLPYIEQSKSWSSATQTTARNVLHLDAENLAQVVVHPGRARLSCHPQLDVTTDGPLTLKLAGCGRTLGFGGA
ncbi:MAG: hypothetical protein AABM42_04265 [Actinomycetota bacterium]